MGYIFTHLRSLEDQHRKLDEEIRQMTLHHSDESLIKRAKQAKLRLKDEIDQLKQHEKLRQFSNYQP